MIVETKSANQLYKESGSELPFKLWIEEQKEKGLFIPNPKLQEKVEEEIQETVSTTPSSKFNKRYVMIGALIGVGVIAYFVLNKKQR
jgi:hypothetical protein